MGVLALIILTMNKKNLLISIIIVAIVILAILALNKNANKANQEAATAFSCPTSASALVSSVAVTAPATIVAGQMGIPVLKLQIKAGNCPIDVAGIKLVPAVGSTMTQSDIIDAHLYYNGTLAANNLALFANNTISFNNAHYPVAAGGTLSMEVRIDAHSAAVTNHSVKYQLANSSDITILNSISGTLPINGAFPMTGPSTTIVAGTVSVTTNGATTIAPQSANLNATIIPGTFGGSGTGRFIYGLSSSNLNFSTAPAALGTGTAFSQAVTALNPSATYYFRGCGQNAFLQICGAMQSFTTLPLSGSGVDIQVMNVSWQENATAPYTINPIHVGPDVLNNSVGFLVNIVNNGNTSVMLPAGTVISIYKDSAANRSSLLASLTLFGTTPTIAANGGQQTYGIGGIPGGANIRDVAGNKNLVVVIDESNVLPETNEANNTLTAPIQILP